MTVNKSANETQYGSVVLVRLGWEVGHLFNKLAKLGDVIGSHLKLSITHSLH